MKNALLILGIFIINFEMIAQSTISIPGEYYQIFKQYPLSNEKISFTTPNHSSNIKEVILNEENTYQYLVSLPIVNDSLLSECIKYSMLSLTFEQKVKNLKKGTEIWYGLTNHNLMIDPTVVGIYFKHFADSTRVYVRTTYSLEFSEKKPKTNTSKYICETLKFILAKSKKKE